MTRVREQFSRISEQLNRIEQAQAQLRDESTERADRQVKQLEQFATGSVQRHEEVLEKLAEFQAESLVGEDEEVDAGEEDMAQIEEEAESAAAPLSKAELVAVQDEVRELSSRLGELVAQLGSLSKAAAPPVPARAAAAKPAPAPAPAKPVAPAARPAAANRPAAASRVGSR
ncbi:hypothetical protein CCP1ISM_3430001 [Azospirillaceae bacterium]